MKVFGKIILLMAFAVSAVFAQQSELDQGIALYNQGDAAGAVKILRTFTKNHAEEARGWYYLGLAYLKQEKKKDATDALEKAVRLNPQDARAQTALAYVYLLRNNSAKARPAAQAALAIDPSISEAHYVLGVEYMRAGIYDAAYEKALKAVALAPGLAPAYLLKAEALISSFGSRAAAVARPAGGRQQLLREAADALEKYLGLSKPNEDEKYYREYLESLRFFAAYYNRPGNRPPVGDDSPPPPPSDQTPLKILSKPTASYTDRARQAGVSGTILLMVGFSESGRIEHVLVIKPLGFGLDQEAVRAARGIKFEPAVRNGQKVASVRTVEYTFTIY